MKIIVKGKRCGECYEFSCHHSKPVSNAQLGDFPVWQERTVSISEFDKKFSNTEGAWQSKGKNHCEVDCSSCYGSNNKPHKHCRRQMPDEKFWFVEFKDIEDFKNFLETEKFFRCYIEKSDGVGITIDLN